LKTIYVDGSCSTNPGHFIAYGFVAYNEDGSKFSECNGVIPITDKLAIKARSMTAESLALLKAVDYAILNTNDEDLTFYTDSLTVANVINGLTLPRVGKDYSIVIADIRHSINLIEELGNEVKVIHCRRSRNKVADALCKEAYHNFIKVGGI
jgi:ribonuclease HI